MASNTEAIVIGDVVKQEEDGYYCREERTTLASEVISIGEVCLLNSASKMIACGVAVDEVQTITPNVEAGVNEVQTITPSVGANANEVHTITFDAAMTAGVLDVTYWAPDGTPIPVAVAWDTDWATTMAAWNTQSTVAATVWAGGASVGAVMTGTATVPILTYSGVGFTNNPITTLALADVGATTGPVNATTVLTTAGSGVIARGFYRLGITDLSGNLQWTPLIAHDGNAAAINTGLDDALGLAGVVATGGPMNGPTAIVLTYSGTGYTNRPHAMVEVAYGDLVGLDDVSIVRTTIGEGETGGGYWRLGLKNLSGVFLWTENIAHDANLAAINLAIENALGAASLVVASGGPLGGASPAALVITFSGTGYTELPQEMVQVDVSDVEGLAHVTIVETTAGHTAGGDATAVALTAFSSASDGTAIFIFRGPCILDADAMTYPTGGQANAVAALKELGIAALSEPTLTEVLT